ncbi:MAG: TonB-dependent receptor [Candidatus Symbiothrix sp.]|jgi:outer membrane cobalamin receptor|nr:TonB-dependent receptor [Candidatus Symbiothrix sp.]
MAKQFPVFLICYFFAIHCSFAQSDTVRTHDLQEVSIQAKGQSPAYVSTSVQQQLTAGRLEKLNALQVSDAVKHFSGVQVKDYGGVGGLKTVSLRSLGANYTAVAYDGISVSDNQTGQIDLGRFSLDNVECISLTIGESDLILQPARNQALGGVINMITQSFDSKNDGKRHLKASLKTGSFGLFNSALLLHQPFNPVFQLNATGEYLTTKGNYPFMQMYGRTDSVSKEKRLNSDVETLKLETNLSGKFKNGGKLLWKAYALLSNRGAPGSAIYYNPYSGERAEDRNFFTQIHYEQALNQKIDFQANAKVNFAGLDYLNLQPSLHNRYYQREYYLNTGWRYKLSEYGSVAWVNDGVRGTMYSVFSNPKREINASRTTWLSAFSGKYERQRWTITGSLLYQRAVESLHTDRHHLSPYIGFSIQPLTRLPLRLRLFYKNTYRLPTFGDMYFSPAPNLDLKAENAHQSNAGLTWTGSFGDWIPNLTLSADVYHNRIENKIVAMPRGSMVVWSVLNYGEASVNGLDVNVSLRLAPVRNIAAVIQGNYTCQDVRDKTDGSACYNQHLPYTPRHTGSGLLGLEMPWFDFNYNLIYSGLRYSNQTRQRAALLKSYTEQGLSLTKAFLFKSYTLRFSAECRNLWNTQYEVVKDYPMPGRSFYLGIKFIY